MAKLTREQIVTIEVLHQRGQAASQTARLLGVTEGTVRYHRRRASARGHRWPPEEHAGSSNSDSSEAVELWWQAQIEVLGESRPPNVQMLWAFLQAEYGYDGSYKSVRKYVRRRFEPSQGSARSDASRPRPGLRRRATGASFASIDLGDAEGPADAFTPS